jgi:hypothetical protein
MACVAPAGGAGLIVAAFQLLPVPDAQAAAERVVIDVGSPTPLADPDGSDGLAMTDDEPTAATT